jgi:hypothetical protein
LTPERKITKAAVHKPFSNSMQDYCTIRHVSFSPVDYRT